MPVFSLFVLRDPESIELALKNNKQDSKLEQHIKAIKANKKELSRHITKDSVFVFTHENYFFHVKRFIEKDGLSNIKKIGIVVSDRNLKEAQLLQLMNYFAAFETRPLIEELQKIMQRHALQEVQAATSLALRNIWQEASPLNYANQNGGIYGVNYRKLDLSPRGGK